MPEWVHIFAIMCNLAIVGFGALFLSKNNLESEHEKNKGSSGVKIMVCSDIIHENADVKKAREKCIEVIKNGFRYI